MVVVRAEVVIVISGQVRVVRLKPQATFALYFSEQYQKLGTEWRAM